MPSVTAVRNEAVQIQEAWETVDVALTVSGMTLTEFQQGLTDLDNSVGEVAQLEAALKRARNDRDAQRDQLWDQIKRAKSGVKGQFGDDSSEYEMFGGKRQSDRGK